MAEDFAAAVSGLGALAEPARRALYRYVAAAAAPVSREQAAAACGLPHHSAKFHLDRLVEEGLLEVEYRRLSGRSGPGAGRPAKLYRRSGREVSVSLPERRYDLAGEVLAAGIEESTRSGTSVHAGVESAAAARGRAMARSAASRTGSPVDQATAVLDEHGFEPRADDGGICLANCPFDRLARDHVALVCGMNLALVSGVLDELGHDELAAVLDPEPGLCCVKVRGA